MSTQATTLAAEPPRTRLDPSEICTLSQRSRDDRIAWVRAEILPHVIETIRLEDGLAVELTESAAVSEKLEDLIALERECCSDITFSRRASTRPGRIRLEIQGIDTDSQLVQAFGVLEPAKGLRLAKAAGAGLTLSLLFCCAVPVAAGALFGGTGAALAQLDAPIPIAAGSLMGGAATWIWLGRRHRAAAAQNQQAAKSLCGPDC